MSELERRGAERILREKADQAQSLLAATGLDCWLTFARETDLHPDPGVEQVVAVGVVRNSAFLFGAEGQRVAIVANFDTSAIRAGASSGGDRLRRGRPRSAPGRPAVARLAYDRA